MGISEVLVLYLKKSFYDHYLGMLNIKTYCGYQIVLYFKIFMWINAIKHFILLSEPHHASLLTSQR